MGVAVPKILGLIVYYIMHYAISREASMGLKRLGPYLCIEVRLASNCNNRQILLLLLALYSSCFRLISNLKYNA
jgi:hypothetical protein